MNSRPRGPVFTLLVIRDQEEQCTKVHFLCYFVESSKGVGCFGMIIPLLFIFGGAGVGVGSILEEGGI